jgi:hypothetical protein
MTLSGRGWKRQTPIHPAYSGAKVRRPRRSRAFTPVRVLAVLGLLVVIVLMLPHHITVGGHRLHTHPGFAPYLAPYLFG